MMEKDKGQNTYSANENNMEPSAIKSLINDLNSNIYYIVYQIKNFWPKVRMKHNLLIFNSKRVHLKYRINKIRIRNLLSL